MTQFKNEIPKKSFVEAHGGKVLTTTLLLIPFLIGLTMSFTQEEIYRETLLHPIKMGNIPFNPFNGGAIKAYLQNQPGYTLESFQTGFLYPTIQILSGILMIIGLYSIYRYLVGKDSNRGYVKKFFVTILILAVTVSTIQGLSNIGGSSFKGISNVGFLSMEPFTKLQVLSWDDLKKSKLDIEKPLFGYDKLKYTFNFKNGETRTLLVRISAVESIKSINIQTSPEMSLITKQKVEDITFVNANK